MAEILDIASKVAGIGGLVLGIFLILFREVIRKNVFSNLSKTQSYRVIRLFMILVWSITILGVAMWFYLALIAQDTNGAAGEFNVSISGTVKNENNELIKDAFITIDHHDFEARSKNEGGFAANLVGADSMNVITLRVSHDNYRSHSEDRVIRSRAEHFEIILHSKRKLR